jgi:Protein of unknown function (DUF2804)
MTAALKWTSAPCSTARPAPTSDLLKAISTRCSACSPARLSLTTEKWSK